jgi:regulation of enolase protein 1 (concanavalin A-like superfamily)
MNGDGFRDVVLGEQGYSLHIVPGNGNLTFQPPVTLTTGTWPHGGIVVDVNGDGRRDIVVAHRYGPYQVIVFRNDGQFQFTTLSMPTDRSTTDVTARDLDGDAKVDLVVSGRGGGSDDGPWTQGFVDVYKGNGDATFAAPARFPTAPGTHSVAIGDFTRDGKVDIATSNHSYKLVDSYCASGFKGVDSLSILPGLGGLSFGPPTTFALFPQTYSAAGPPRHGIVRSLNTSDVNRDGFQDLIVGVDKLLLTAAPRANRLPTAFAGADQTITGGVHEAFLPGGGSDPDGHLLSFAWSDGGAGGIFTAGVDAPDNCYDIRSLPYGTYSVTLTADDRNGGTASDSATLTFVAQNDPPSVLVTKPAQGDILTTDVPFTIQWQASDADGIKRIDITFSQFANGQSQPIAECTNLPGTATQCTWKSPGPATEEGQFSVTATDNTGLIGGAGSWRFAIRPPGGTGGLPSGWTFTDVGQVAARGSSSRSNGVFTVRGSGADIGGTADEFHWAYTTVSSNVPGLTADFDFTARVASVQNVNQLTKAGLMIRGNNDAGSLHASLLATPTSVRGVAFQRRRTDGALSVSTAGPLIAPPMWLRLSRRGSRITASYRKAITDPWTRIGSDSIVFPWNPIAVGLVVSSHVDGTLATATFDNVTIDTAPPLSSRDIGAVGVPGTASSDGVRLTIDGSGADIWGTADAFRYVYTSWTGDGTVIARVRSIENTHASAKAGVMFREALTANSKHVMTVVTPGRGVLMQYRNATAGLSAQAGSIARTAPEWVRLKRAGNTFTGAVSNDGVTWTNIGIVTVPMASTIYVGFPVTSHNNATLATAVFDDLVFRP